VLNEIIKLLKEINAKLDRIEKKVDSLETRMNTVETKLSQVESDIKIIKNQTASVTETLVTHHKRIGKLDRIIDGLKNAFRNLF